MGVRWEYASLGVGGGGVGGEGVVRARERAAAYSSPLPPVTRSFLYMFASYDVAVVNYSKGRAEGDRVERSGGDGPYTRGQREEAW